MSVTVIGKYRFADMPEGVRMVVYKDGTVYYNLKHKEQILKEFDCAE